MPTTRGLCDFWGGAVHKARIAENEVTEFEKRMTNDGALYLSTLIKNKLPYTSTMHIIGFSSENPDFDNFEKVQATLEEAMADWPSTCARTVITSWVDDLMEKAYFQATMYMNMVPFEGPCVDKIIFKDPATVPLKFEECFPTLFEWGSRSADKKRKFTTTASIGSPNYTNSSHTKASQPATFRKSMPPYRDTAVSSYDSPEPTRMSTKVPRGPVKHTHTIKKVARVLLWGEAGGVDGYGGGV
jgi:hypothetical protein